MRKVHSFRKTNLSLVNLLLSYRFRLAKFYKKTLYVNFIKNLFGEKINDQTHKIVSSSVLQSQSFCQMQQEQLQISFECPFCKYQTNDMRKHLQLNCLSSTNISAKQKSSFRYRDQSSVCLRCYIQTSTLEFRHHLKSCKRNYQKSIKEKSSRQSSILQAKTLSNKEQNSQSKPNKLINSSPLQHSISIATTLTLDSLESDTIQIFQNYLLSSSQPFLIQWIRDHQEFRKIFLFIIFQKFVSQMEKRLLTRIPKIQWSDLYGKLKSFQWKDILKRPEEIFDRDHILDITKNINKNEKAKVLSAINKIYSNYPNNLFQKFKIEIEKSIPKAIPKPLCHIQLIQIMSKLLQTKLRKMVHICIDLMILFQAGQRYPSSIPLIQQVLLQHLKKSKQNRGEIYLRTSKTKKNVLLVFSNQLISILQSFNWNGFYCNKRFGNSFDFYSRISIYLPFTVYAIRHGYMCFLQLMQENLNKASVHLLSQHTNRQNLDYYTQSVTNKRLQDHKNLLKIPNCKIDYVSKEQVLNSLPKTDRLYVKINLNSNWLYRFVENINRDDPSIDECNMLMHDIGNILQQLREQVNDKIEQVAAQVISEHQSQSSEQAEITREDVNINGRTFTRINHKFDLLTLYIKINQGVCSICRMRIQKEGYQCIYCGDSYHINAQCFQQFCLCLQYNKSKFGLRIQSNNKQSQLKLIMPQKYLVQNREFLLQSRFLIHTRGFSFTNTAIAHSSVKNIITLDMNVAEMKLKLFDEYRQYKYIPPLRIQVTNLSNANGTGFGLFAQEEIQKFTFIGEYAGDIILRNQTYLLKRTDMIMCIRHADRSSQSIQIAPLQFSGYVMLVNQSKKNPNCAVVTCVVNDELKVILYALKKIKMNEELTYNYDLSFSKNSINIENLQEIPANLINTIDPQQNQQFDQSEALFYGIINYGSNCYINSIFQLFKRFHRYFIVEDNQQNMLLIELKKFYDAKSLYDPIRVLDIIEQSTNLFPRDLHGDAHEFFGYVLNIYQTKHKIDFMKGSLEQSFNCNNCSHNFKNKSLYQTIVFPPHQSLSSIINQNRRPETYKCDKCQKRETTQSSIVYTDFPKLLILYYARFKDGKKSHDEVKQKQILQLGGNQYIRRFLILHYGQDRHSGHYNAIDCLSNILFNDQMISQWQGYIPLKSIYMAVYERL